MKLNCLDYLNISNHFSDEELMVQNNAYEFCRKEVAPIIEEYYEKGEFPMHLVSKFAELGFFGVNLPEKYECGGMSNIDFIYENINDALKKYVFTDTLHTKVVKNIHGDSSGVRGAAWLS